MVFKKILIANRGEIAVRIIRACSEMGIKSVAVFSEADRHALHVKKADEAYSLGDDPLSGYLNVHNLVNLAKETGCDAIHPGYGFLSENPLLAQVCKERNVAFIGPDSEVIRTMGDKILARNAMIAAGLPVVPGSESNLESLDEARVLAERIGYPVMLKATNGGGGRGIRRCDNQEELDQNWDRVRSEVKKAFGSPEIFMEKCVVNPRHIEVQVLADKHGNAIHLFERDCSIQRRNQKLIEIAPSPQLREDQRQYIGGLAVIAARSVNYENAGTVEFLMDDDDRFYFMEMNTRVQVEHPITEQITGVDIIREQIRVASGLALSIRQEEVRRRGFSIQFRVNAEDPRNNFLPTFGRVTRSYLPGGPGVRVDTAIYTGYTIPPFYDSMCAKVIVTASDWEEAIRRSERVLEETKLSGITTTIPYYLEIVRSPEFRSGSFTTGFVDAHPRLARYHDRRSPEDLAAILAAAMVAHAGL